MPGPVGVSRPKEEGVYTHSFYSHQLPVSSYTNQILYGCRSSATWRLSERPSYHATAAAVFQV
jgi:hypothetical protein